MKIVLFDIDGTLLHSGGAGKNAMMQTFEELFRIKNGFAGISMAGKTDPLIIKTAFENHSINPTADIVDQFKKRYFELLAENIKLNYAKKKIYPGVSDLLDALAEHPEIIMGLLTGNWQEGARIKLSYFNFDRYFSFGAFGSDSIDRNELLPIALKRCEIDNRNGWKNRDVVVIGDTPNDVQCAKVHNALALAVATGTYSVDDLYRSGADLALDDLSDVESIKNWILKKK
ncbi:MAG TPA: HAD family hydrolase [Bacteroidetes bacterium]|nr:HAD family hydrolase [Bacteroidota bacterium]